MKVYTSAAELCQVNLGGNFIL